MDEQTDGFTQMVDAAQPFFVKLAANNTRDWFEQHKTHYMDDIRKPGEFFADLMSEELSRMLGEPIGAKVYRIYRDVRFSKDKTPYNTHLHISFPREGDDPLRPGFFFAIETDSITLHHGLFDLRGEALTRWRALIDKWGGLLAEAIEETGARISDYGPPPLKKVPKPYAPDHPHGDLLRRKGLILSRDVDADWRARGLFDAVAEGYARFLPVTRLLDRRL